MEHCMYLVKFFLLFLSASRVFSIPTPKNEVEEIFTGTKRDASSAATASLLKSYLYNPYLFPGAAPFFPGKPVFYPFLTPSDILLNRFAKSAPTSSPTPLQKSMSEMGDFLETKKNEFITKMQESINGTNDSLDLPARSVTPGPEDSDGPIKPTIDPSFFINKKLDFLEKLFKSLNTTTTTVTSPTSAVDDVTTPKPTIVPPGFWFPFIKLPKPPKAPKPTKPPKTKKILKDALDTAILQSLLMELGIDPLNGTLSRRAVGGVSTAKKVKSKKVKAEEESPEFHIPTKIDPTLYSSKASDCLDKLFKILSKADAEDLTNFIEPKATVVPSNMWTQPSDTEYTSKLDAFLDLLLKSLNATDGVVQPPGKSYKSKKIESLPKIIRKRSTFLDELLHRIPPSTTPNPMSDTISSKCKCTKSSCCCGSVCAGDDETADKSTRSLIFKPFGTGYWIPQYLYAAKMNMYLDKLMDTMNTGTAEDDSTDGTSIVASMKRSAAPADSKINITGLSPKDAALTLLISELVDVKNDIVEAFADGVKAQKDATTGKPFNPAGKSFKKPFWGPKAAPTTDPVEPIQKRIDILTDIFDKITEVEKALLFADDADDPKVFKSIKDSLQSDPKIGNTRLGASKFGKSKSTGNTVQDEMDTASPDYYMEKTKEFLQSLYANQVTDAN